MTDRSERDRRFVSIVRRIPRGAVATYGQIARLAGFPRHARHVGQALRALDDDDVPWHRVINGGGTISRRSRSDSDELQRSLLEAEGIEFRGDRIDLERYGWDPPKQV